MGTPGRCQARIPERPCAQGRAVGRPLAALTLVLGGALVAPAVRAQTCEQFRDTLAARFDPGIRGFAMEIVAGSAPVPAGAKVFGTCEGGARKILFFRNGRPAGAGESAATSFPAPSAPVAAAAAVPVASAPATRVRAAPMPAPSAPSVAAAPPKAVVLPAQPVRAASAPAVSTGAKAVGRMASSATTSRAEPPRVDEPVTAVASEAASWPALRSVTEPAASAAADAASSASDEPGLPSRLWPWFAGGAGLLGVLLLWGWIAHRRAYDANGLPRGPRLRV
jgi:hypothetical protein